MKKQTMSIGDIFQIGEHRVACGDSRDKTIVAKLLGKNRVSLILTDIPYGVAYVESKAGFIKTKTTHVPIANDHLQSDSEFALFTHTWLAAVHPHMNRKNAGYTFCSDKMLFAFHDGMTAAGWRFGQMLHWIKTAAVMARLDYAPQHESILYFWLGTHEFMKSKDRSVIIHPKPSKNVFHPTEKPIPILRRLILNSSRIGDLVYDPFAGSGTTGIASEHTKRRCAMVELNPAYCQIILDRLEKITGTKPKKISTTSHE